MSSFHSRAAGRLRPRARGWVVGAGLVAVLLPAAPAMAAGSHGTTVHDAAATLRVVVRDALDENNKIIEQPVTLLEMNGQRYPVTDNRLGQIAPNSTLRVDGTINDGTLSLSNVTATAPAPTTSQTKPAAGAADGTTDTHVVKDLVVLAYWTAPDGNYTQASAQAEVANDDAWFKEVSYGAEGISATATPWVKIANPGADCNEYAVVDSARAAAAAVGYDYTQYDRTLVYFPRATCPWAGVSTIGGDWSVFNGSLSTSMTTHEQGHELGFYHAHSYLCTGDDGYVSMADWCDGSEYGDPYDTMGKGGPVHYNGAEKDMIGWLPDGRRVDMTPGSSTTLAPLEQQAAAPQVAKLQVSDSRRYYIEYRQLQGYDSSLAWDGKSTHGTDGVIIHATDASRSGWDWGTLLLDMSPDANFYEATLKSGQSWTTPEGWTINVGAISPTGAEVSVTAAAATAPTAPRWPTAYPGDGSAFVYWAPPASDGGSPVTSYTLIAHPGGQSITVPADSASATLYGLTNGTPYTFTVTATNSVGTSPESEPSNEVTPQGEDDTTTYEEAGFDLKGWSVVSDASATDGSYRSAIAAGETATFSFTGTNVTWQARGGPDAGKAKVTIDGVSKGTVDLYRSTPMGISVPFTPLASGNHTIVIKATGKKSAASAGSAVRVDGFQADSEIIADSDPAVAYSGWTGVTDAAASGGAYRVNTAKKTTVSFAFSGTAVSWVSAMGPAYGKAQVLIDGVARGTFDQYAASTAWQTTHDFTGLGAGQHTITIKALGTKRAASKGTGIVVDALVVTS